MEPECTICGTPYETRGGLPRGWLIAREQLVCESCRFFLGAQIIASGMTIPEWYVRIAGHPDPYP